MVSGYQQILSLARVFPREIHPRTIDIWLMNKIQFPSWNGRKNWTIDWLGICTLSTSLLRQNIPKKLHFTYPHPPKKKCKCPRNVFEGKMVTLLDDLFHNTNHHQNSSKSQLITSIPAVSGEWRRSPSEVKNGGGFFFSVNFIAAGWEFPLRWW